MSDILLTKIGGNFQICSFFVAGFLPLQCAQ